MKKYIRSGRQYTIYRVYKDNEDGSHKSLVHKTSDQDKALELAKRIANKRNPEYVTVMYQDIVDGLDHDTEERVLWSNLDIYRE